MAAARLSINHMSFTRCFRIEFSKCQFQSVCRRYGTGTAGALNTLKSSDVEVRKTTDPKPKPDWNKLTFGHHFSDHMLSVDWDNKTGWHRPIIHPVEELKIHPAAKVFHYAIELFEGLKAYRGADGTIRLFRPDENMKRMNNTAARCSLPTFDGHELLKLLKKLITLDKDWVPKSAPSSLYIRPTMIGTEATIGVNPSNSARLFVLIGPVGPYFPSGLKPISLMADPSYVRAWVGGTGNYKMGANYAPTMYTQRIAAEMDCQQVLWLYGPDHEVTEVGAMNLFMYWENEEGQKELITCPLNGVILPGVTRKSILDLGHKWGEFQVTERVFTMSEIQKALLETRVYEIFGSGTACSVCPVERIVYQGVNLHIPTMDTGAKLCNRYLTELQDIQYGRVKNSWAEVVC